MEETRPSLAARAGVQLEAVDMKLTDIDELLRDEDDLQGKSEAPEPLPKVAKRRIPKPTSPKPEPSPAAETKYKQLSFYVSREEYFALRTASVDREGRGKEPFGHEKMARAALRAWLSARGYLDKKAA